MRVFRVLIAGLLLLAGGAGASWAQGRVVTGTVTDSVSGDPLEGARISVRGTAIGVLAGADGRFAILNAPTGAFSIVVRTIGYKSSEVSVAAGQSTVDVALARDYLQLEAVVVTGQATTVERRNLANAVARVEGEEFERAPAASMEQALAGKVAGADVQSNSGAPGGGMQVRMRGVTSINAASEPLYVVDGVIISNVAIPSNQNAVTRASGLNNPSLVQDNQVNRIADINPNDIESVEVLKGASAAAIYGSKAASGVVIVTTRRGKAGKPEFRLSQKLGVFDLSNTLGARTFETAQEVDDHFGAGTAAAIGFQPGRVFDHEEELSGRNDLSYETALSVSGGGADTRYFASGLLKRDEGIMIGTGFEKQALRVNLDQQLGSRANLSLQTNVIRTLAQRGLSNNDNAGVSPFMVYPFTPNIVDLQANASGVFPVNPFERSNPLQTLTLSANDETVHRYILGGRLTLDPVVSPHHQLRFIASGGSDYFSQENDLLFPRELQFEPQDGLPGTSLLSNSSSRFLNAGWSLVYTYVPASGSIRATTSGGMVYNRRDLTVSRIESRNLSGGPGNVNTGTAVQVREDRLRAEDRSFYLQEEVLLANERLLLTGGVTGDQSSNNADDSKLFFYPKVSASYRFPQIGDLLGFADELKLRAAYGESGNQPLYGQKFTPLTSTQNIGGLPSLIVAGQVGSPDLHPERQREIEGGFDATLFDGQATVEFTLYQKTISDLLLERELAPSSGFQSEIFNGGTMRVQGVELGLAASPIQTPALTWVARANFFSNSSEITELPVPTFQPRNAGFGVDLGSYQIEQGKSATQIVGNIPVCTFQTSVPCTGALADSSYIGAVGDANPDFKIGFSNDISYRRFKLFFNFDWQQGGSIVNLTKLLYDAGGNTVDYDAPAAFYNPDGTVADSVPRGLERIVRWLGGETGVWVEDASFVKLREVTLSYDLPQQFVSSVWRGLRFARLNVSARNLLTFFGYDGLDPEVSNFGNQGIGRNIDVAPYPPSRSFWFGIDVGF